MATTKPNYAAIGRMLAAMDHAIRRSDPSVRTKTLDWAVFSPKVAVGRIARMFANARVGMDRRTLEVYDREMMEAAWELDDIPSDYVPIEEQGVLMLAYDKQMAKLDRLTK